MNKSAVSLALAGTLSLAALAGCGSSSATSSPSTSVSSTTTTPSASAASSATSAASSDAGTATSGSSATGSPSTSVSSSTTVSGSTPSSTSSTTSTPAATTIRIAGATLTVDGWRFTAPFGWGHATTTKDGAIYHDWVSSQSKATSLMLIASQLDKNENFTDDIRDTSHDFGKAVGVDMDSPISIKGADRAQELAGTRTNKSKTQYLDVVFAVKGRDLVMVAATAPTKALMMSSGAHAHLMSLSHV